MSRTKYTEEIVRNAVELSGYTFKGFTKSSNNRTLLMFVCQNGHEHSIKTFNFMSGQRCGICARNKPINIEVAKATFNERGYQLLEDSWKGNKVKMKCLCPQNHELYLSWNNFTHRGGCIQCSSSAPVGIKKVQEFFNLQGYKLFETEWKNSHTKMLCECPKKHRYYISWHKFSQGVRCAECAGNKRIDINDAKKAFESVGYTLLENVWVNNQTKLRFVCDKGHRNSIAWYSFQQGVRCSDCAVSGFKSNKPGTLYYVRFTYKDRFYYKIGITNRTVQERFIQEPTQYKVIHEERYLIGKRAFDKEQSILNTYKEFKYTGMPFLLSGNTELFTKDILELDQDYTS